MQSKFITPPDLLQLQNELLYLETVLLHGSDGLNTQPFTSLLAPTFWETGASGRRYSRSDVLPILNSRKHAESEISETIDECFCEQIGEKLFLLSYRITLSGLQSRRVSLWQKSNNNWEIIYHQGTPIQQ